jgi:hypothetical protein
MDSSPQQRGKLHPLENKKEYCIKYTKCGPSAEVSPSSAIMNKGWEPSWQASTVRRQDPEMVADSGDGAQRAIEGIDERI